MTDSMLYVVDGRHRLLALRELFDDGKLPGNWSLYMVPVEVYLTTARGSSNDQSRATQHFHARPRVLRHVATRVSEAFSIDVSISRQK